MYWYNMYGEQTPHEEETPIDWDYYTERSFSEVQELLTEFVEENLVIQRYIREDQSGYLDYSFTEDEEIDKAVDADLEANEHIEYDSYDQEGDDIYMCTHCNKRFEYASNFMDHAINFIYQNNKVDDLTRPMLRPSQFLCLLVDNIWNKEEGIPYTEYMEQFVRHNPQRLHEFFNYMGY